MEQIKEELIIQGFKKTETRIVSMIQKKKFCYENGEILNPHETH